MPVSAQTPFNNYIGNGVTTAFAFSFLVLQAGDLVVKVAGVALVNGVGYTIAGIGSTGGGTVTMTSAPANGATVAIYRSSSITRTTDYQTNGDFLADTVDADFDRLWLVMQELFSGPSGFGRMLKVPSGETVLDLPVAASRANLLLSFDSSGNPTVSAPAAGSASALAIQLLLANLSNSGAGQVGYGDSIAYGASTVGAGLRVRAPVVNSIAALKALLKTGTPSAFVTGYYAAGDGGGGAYYYDAADTVSSDNGGTIIVASDGGRWKLAYTGVISVKQFGAKGDGIAGDGVLINAASAWARAIGKSLYFPTPSAYYNTTGTPLVLGSTSHWFGENGAATTIRNNSGAGASVLTCDSTGSLGPYVLEHLRIGGAGSIGITSTPTSFNGTIVGTALTVNSGLVGGIEIGGTVTGAGVTAGTTIVSGAGSSWVITPGQAVGPVTMTMTSQYVANLTLKHVHFESDLLTGVDANCIFANWQDCSFGFYTQTATNAAFAAFKMTGNGTLNDNLNVYQRLRIYNSPATYAVVLSSGVLHRFIDCDWEGNLRNLSTNNVTGLILDNCYTERVSALTGQAFDFGLSRTRVKVTGGQYNGNSLVAGVSMFGAATSVPLLVEDADISTSASAFAFINSTTLSHTPQPLGLHHFKDNRIQGNAADPMLWMDNILEGVAYAWTPVPTNLTVVNNSGLPTYTGQYWIVGRQCFFSIKGSVPGATTTAANANSTFFLPPNPNMPIAATSAAVGVTDENLTGTTLGVGCVYSGNGRIFMPTWAARVGNFAVSGSFFF